MNYQQLSNLLLEFIYANSREESKRMVEANPVLLSNEADTALGWIMKAYESHDKQTARILEGISD